MLLFLQETFFSITEFFKIQVSFPEITWPFPWSIVRFFGWDWAKFSLSCCRQVPIVSFCIRQRKLKHFIYILCIRTQPEVWEKLKRRGERGRGHAREREGEKRARARETEIDKQHFIYLLQIYNQTFLLVRRAHFCGAVWRQACVLWLRAGTRHFWNSEKKKTPTDSEKIWMRCFSSVWSIQKISTSRSGPKNLVSPQCLHNLA